MNKIFKKVAVSAVLVGALAIGGGSLVNVVQPSGGGDWPTPITPKIPIQE